MPQPCHTESVASPKFGSVPAETSASAPVYQELGPGIAGNPISCMLEVRLLICFARSYVSATQQLAFKGTLLERMQ